MYAGCFDETPQIPNVRRQDGIPVLSQDDQRGVDDVGGARPSEQQAGPSPERFVETGHFEPRQQSRERRLTA